MLAMRLLISALIVTLAIAALSAIATEVRVAAQELPVGEFQVVPTSVPIGTSVTVSGNFDREITSVRFECWHSDTPDLGVDVAYTAPEPSPTFTFAYTIPAELNISQPMTSVVTRTPLGGACEFLAEAGHRLLTASVPFTVTEAVAPPSTGLASRSHNSAGAPAAAVMLAVAGVALVLLGWKGVSTT